MGFFNNLKNTQYSKKQNMAFITSLFITTFINFESNPFSDFLGYSSSFWNKVFPIFMCHRLLPFSFQNLFIVWILSGTLCVRFLFCCLPAHGVSILFLSQLFKRLRWLIVSRSKDLILILLSDVYLFIDCAFVNDYSFIGVLVSLDNVSIKIIWLWSHHIGHLVQTLFGNVLKL